MFLIKENGRKGRGVRASEGGKEGGKKQEEKGGKNKRKASLRGALELTQKSYCHTLNNKYV